MIVDYVQQLWHNVLQKCTSWWVVIGLLGQLLFGLRYVVQWIASERAKRSVIPVAFWRLSLTGSMVLLVYAIYIADPVFILANLFTGLVFVRNLTLIGKEKRASGAG